MVMNAEKSVSVTVFFHSEYDLCYLNANVEHREDYVHPEGQIPSEVRIEELGREIAAREEVSEVKFTSDEEAWAKFGPEYFESRWHNAVKLCEERGVALYCGEYGVIDRSAPEDALSWFKDIHTVFEKYSIGRAAWSYKAMDFGISDKRMDSVRDELIKNL
jgi:hypothetical protein